MKKKIENLVSNIKKYFFPFYNSKNIKLLFKNLIVSSMNYKTFAWPPPITFGLGLMFFQDHLKDGIKKEINYLTQQQ